MELHLDIKANAIDSINEALAKYELGAEGDIKSLKFAVLHLSHGMELLLKIYLQTLDENLVFSKCYKLVKKDAKSKNLTLFVSAHSEAFYLHPNRSINLVSSFKQDETLYHDSIYTTLT